MSTTAPNGAHGYADLIPLWSTMTGDEKHTAAATSTLDVLWVLYDRILRVSPSTADDPERDRFLLSKGHGPQAFYAVLAAKGFLDPTALANIAAFDSALGFHPDRNLLAGVEISSGSLGQGLGLAVGVALGLRAAGRTRPHVWVLVGDAELDEGSNDEAIAYAGAIGLDTLHVVVVDNESASYRQHGGLAARFATAGWATADVDGRDHDAMHATFTTAHPGRPFAVVASVEKKDS